VFILLSFGLDRGLNSPRIAVRLEPYPRRRTHHMVIARPEELDEEVLGWLQEAHAFAQIK